jgi:uncharacterized protein with GYD domain
MEAPNDETPLEFALNIGKMGNARTTALKAWSSQDAAKVIGRVSYEEASRPYRPA